MGLLRLSLRYAYMIFFLIHLVVMFFVDLYPLYPAAIRPELLDTIRSFYLSTYKDKLFVSPPLWFIFYTCMEAIYHIPLSFWMVGAIWRGDGRVALQLLIFALQAGITTATCIMEFTSWTDVTGQQKMELLTLYGPYLGLAVVMGVDSYLELRDRLISTREVTASKKAR